MAPQEFAETVEQRDLLEYLQRMIQRTTARVVISTLAEALRREAAERSDDNELIALNKQYLAHLAKEVDAVAEQALARAVEP